MTVSVLKFADFVPALLAVTMVGCGQQGDNLDALRARQAEMIANNERIIANCRDVKLKKTVTRLLDLAKSDLANQQDTAVAELTLEAANLTDKCLKFTLQSPRSTATAAIQSN